MSVGVPISVALKERLLDDTVYVKRIIEECPNSDETVSLICVSMQKLTYPFTNWQKINEERFSGCCASDRECSDYSYVLEKRTISF